MRRAMAAKKRSTLEDELNELRAVSDDPRSEDATKRLRAGLASKRAMVVARAATIIKERRLDGFTAELKDAYARFLEDPVKTDLGCRAKTAVLEALDYTETMDEAPFLAAVRYVQIDQKFPEENETAGGIRSRALLALARIGSADLPLLAGEALADRQAHVRAAAADAIGAFGIRNCAGALLLKLARPDEDPLVTLACMSALMALAPDYGLGFLAPLLSSPGEERELAALALGQTAREDALALLLGALDGAVTPDEREPLFRALGLHRSEKAAAKLLAVVETSSAVDAGAAIQALATRRYEPGMRERVEEAAKKNKRARLDVALAEAFRE